MAQLNIREERETFRMETQNMLLQKEEDKMGNWLDEYFEEEKEKEEISNIKRNKETLPNFDSADEMIKL